MVIGLLSLYVSGFSRVQVGGSTYWPGISSNMAPFQGFYAGWVWSLGFSQALLTVLWRSEVVNCC